MSRAEAAVAALGPMETKVIDEGGAVPDWNEEIRFEKLESPAAYALEVTVLDRDSALGTVPWMSLPPTTSWALRRSTWVRSRTPQSSSTRR